jgi:hypothetical protein
MEAPAPLDLVEDVVSVVDSTKQGSNSLGLQVQSVVTRVNFPHEET